MPIVKVSIWEGITPENKKKTVEGITKVFEDRAHPKKTVHIVIYEAPKTNLGNRRKVAIRKIAQKSKMAPEGDHSPNLPVKIHYGSTIRCNLK